MIQITRDSCIRIPVTDDIKNSDWFRSIQLNLIRSETPYGAKAGEVVYKKYYGVDFERKEFLIPRFYPINGVIPDFSLIDYVNEGKDIDIESNVTPRDDRQRECIDYLLENDKGIICMQPGEGKTVVTIAAICKIKKKSIIYVHKDSLSGQWLDRFNEHAKIDPDKIKILKTKDYRDTLLNCDIVITTSQGMCSLMRRKPDLNQVMKDAQFGVAVWDECHTCAGAEQYSKCSLITPAKKTFGLSATPERSDGNTDIMEMHLGKIFTPTAGDISTMIPKVIMMKFKFNVYPNHQTYIMRNTAFDKKNGYKPEFDRMRYLKLMTSSKHSKYKKVLGKIVKQVVDSDRIMFCLSDRIDTLDALAKFCKNKKDEVGFFIPRSGKERDEHLTRRLVFSTYGSCRDGVDKKEVDCLIMANPTGNWEQAIGRALRQSKDKQQPVIIDLIDLDVEHLKDWGERRKEKYLEKGWIVEERVIKYVR